MQAIHHRLMLGTDATKKEAQVKVNLPNIAARHWLEYQRGDLDVLAEVYIETVKACAEVAGRHSPEARADILDRATGHS